MSKSKFETHEIELSNEELSSAQGGYFPYVPENDLVKMLRELLEKTRKEAAAAGG